MSKLLVCALFASVLVACNAQGGQFCLTTLTFPTLSERFSEPELMFVCDNGESWELNSVVEANVTYFFDPPICVTVDPDQSQNITCTIIEDDLLFDDELGTVRIVVMRSDSSDEFTVENDEASAFRVREECMDCEDEDVPSAVIPTVPSNVTVDSIPEEQEPEDMLMDVVDDDLLEEIASAPGPEI